MNLIQELSKRFPSVNLKEKVDYFKDYSLHLLYIDDQPTKFNWAVSNKRNSIQLFIEEEQLNYAVNYIKKHYEERV